MASTGADYRYGYNGMEEEDRGDQVSAEIASTGEKPKPGEGNLINTEYRLYDPRLAQWLTRDPIFQPWESPYSAMAGNPILFSDPQGLATNDPNKDANVAKPTEAGQHIDYEGGHFMSVPNSDGNLYWAVSTKEIVVTPSVNNWSISASPESSGYHEIVKQWQNINSNAPNTGNIAFLPFWMASNLLYSSLDALQITASNIFHKLHLTELPARHLDNTYANDNQVQDAGVNMVIEGVTFGAGKALKLVTKGREQLIMWREVHSMLPMLWREKHMMEFEQRLNIFKNKGFQEHIEKKFWKVLKWKQFLYELLIMQPMV